MATTRIIPMHLNKGKTLAQCLADRTEYGMNPDKTEGGALISAFACEPETAVSEFALSKREYRELTGRVQESDVIAYQVRQSFKPGEVTPEEANRIGYEFAKRFLKGRHAFLVCTHTDKKHIHNHIYWNSTALDCTKKFKNFIGSYRAVRPDLRRAPAVRGGESTETRAELQQMARRSRQALQPRSSAHGDRRGA